jgi:tRNA 2-thiocytidine biosynthesis protein TtcA
VAEADCDRFSRAMNYPIIPCDLCGSQEGLQRMQAKKLLDDWETRSPGRRQIMFRALMNVRPSHLADPALFDFLALAPGAAPADPDTDTDSGLPPALR